MKHQKSVQRLFIIIIIGLGLFLLSGVGGGGDIKISEATLDRVIQKAPTGRGYLALLFASTLDESRIVNVFVDLNGDGIYAPYKTKDGKIAEEHLVVDFPVSVSHTLGASYPVSIPDTDIDNKTHVNGVAIFSRDSAASSTPTTVPKGAKSISFSIAHVGVMDMSDSMDLGRNDGKRRGWGTSNMAAVKDVVLPTAHAEGVASQRPNAYQQVRTDVPDTNQNYNECAPTAVSNNVRWLAKKYKFEDRIPKDTRELINEIKADLQWNDGVLDPNFIPGKNAFFARRGIPIVTHQIGGKNDVDIHWKMYEEMKKGQAIEIGVTFYDTDENGVMTPAGGHTVSVSGVYRQNGKDYIALNDSATRSRPDAPKSDYYETSGDMIIGYGGTAFIDYAWAQSPIDELAQGTYVDPTKDEKNLVVGGSTLTPPGGEVTRAIGKFGFFFVDIEHPGDHVVGESFPIAATVIKRNTEQTMAYWKDSVRHEYKHRAANPWTLGGTFTARGAAVAPTNKFDNPRNGPISGDRNRAETTFTCTSPGPATISYSASLTWTRGGGDPPAELLPRYATQLEPSETVVVESPTFFCKSATPLPQKSGSHTGPITSFCPDVTEDPNGKEIDVLKVGGECYPTLQFHQAPADKCDALHWHANMESARSLKGSVWVDPHNCGLGRVSEVEAGKIKLSPDQVAPYITTVPLGR